MTDIPILGQPIRKLPPIEIQHLGVTPVIDPQSMPRLCLWINQQPFLVKHDRTALDEFVRQVIANTEAVIELNRRRLTDLKQLASDTGIDIRK